MLEDQQNREGDATVDAVARDRIGNGPSGVVREQSDRGRPDDPAQSVPEEKPPPRHPRDPRHPGARHPHAPEETREEHRLTAVPLEKALGRRHDAIGGALQPRVALDQPAPTLAADPVADVVADDRSGGGDRDHSGDREMTLGGVNTRGDQRRLTRKPEARGLQADDAEDEPETVVVDELGHRSARVRKIAPC